MPCSSAIADASAGTGEPSAPAPVAGTASGAVAAEEAARAHTHTHTHTARLLVELLRLLEGGIGLDEDSQKSVPYYIQHIRPLQRVLLRI